MTDRKEYHRLRYKAKIELSGGSVRPYTRDNPIKLDKKETNKLNYEKNKTQISSDKVTCECGGVYRTCAKNRHLQTKKHLNF